MSQEKKTKNLGITGASGFIGSYLSEKLSSDFSLRRLLRNPALVLPSDTMGSLENLISVQNFVEDLGTMIHLANGTFPRDSKDHLKQDISINLMNTIHLFEKYAEANPNGHIVFFSSGGAVYDSKLPEVPRKEEDPTHPLSNYGMEKLAAEGFLSTICRQKGIRGTVLRVSNPYGTVLSHERSQGIVGVALGCLMKNVPIKVFGSLDIVRDYIHLSDLESATRAVIQTPPPAGNMNVFNVGVGIGTSLAELFDLLDKFTGQRIQRILSPSNTVDPAWNVLDISRIRSELGWYPTVRLEEGLQTAYKSALRSFNLNRISD